MNRSANRETWTAERVATLTKLWADGVSCTYIAAQLGDGISRNAVIGKVSRLKLPPRLTTQRLSGSNGMKIRNARARRMEKNPKSGQAAIIANLPKQPLPEARLTDVARVQLQDLKEHHCRWPAGDPVRGFCGHQKVKGLSYCETHARRAYEKPVKKDQKQKKKQQFALRVDRKVGAFGYV